MELSELRKLPLPKLREQAKQLTDVEGVAGMKKEEIIQAIAKAQGVSYEAPSKDVSTISSIKQEIRDLKKRKAETLASPGDRPQLERLRKKARRLKRLTRKLARAAKLEATPQPSPAPESAPPAPESQSAPPAPESTAPPESPPAAS